MGVHADHHGVPRLVVPVPSWEDLLRLACDEIRHYGASSLQVVRRLRAMFDDLATVATPERAAVLEDQVALLGRTVERAFVDGDDRAVASQADNQGIGP